MLPVATGGRAHIKTFVLEIAPPVTTGYKPKNRPFGDFLVTL
ncbi:MAG: hypothetical protein AAB840_00355 [Patescibacteria group bacterium]